MVAPLADSRSRAQIAEGASADRFEPQLLDTGVFQELLGALGGDLDTVVSIYRTFLATGLTLIGSLPQQDCITQARTLHTLKGSSTMVGAERMARLAANLQYVAVKAIHPIIKTRIDELTGELDMFREAINAHVKSLQYPGEV